MSVGVVNKQTGDRIPTAGMPAIDSVLSGTSTNPVQNAIITAALGDKQDSTDNNLQTTAKTIVGAINEHEGDIGSLKSGLTNYELQNNINLEVPNRKNLAGNPYDVMLNSSGVFVSANVRSYIIPTNLGTITISVDDITKISDDVIRIGYCDDIPAESGTGVRVSSMTTNTYTITPNTGYKYIVVSNLLDNDYGWQDIQIELGNTATAYTPYIPSVESRIEAVESGLTNLQNKNTVTKSYFVNGKWYKIGSHSINALGWLDHRFIMAYNGTAIKAIRLRSNATDGFNNNETTVEVIYGAATTFGIKFSQDGLTADLYINAGSLRGNRLYQLLTEGGEDPVVTFIEPIETDLTNDDMDVIG